MAKLRFVALTTLIVWLGTAYHDFWLTAANVSHHHEPPHHHHDGPSHHHHDPGSDSDHSKSIPLPDVNSTPLVLTKAPGTPQSLELYDVPDLGIGLCEHFRSHCVVYANAPPIDREPEIQRLILQSLVTCVRANAPPSLS